MIAEERAPQPHHIPSLTETSCSPMNPWLMRGIVGLSLTSILAYLWVAVRRLCAPFELEWMEGGMLAHAARLIEGLPIYATPSVDFVPFFYTPGYPQLLAWLSEWTGGLSFTLGRSVSLSASLGLMALIFHAVKRESSWMFGLLGAGLYAALFRTNGAFYDLVRPDSLAALLTGGVIYVAYFYRGARAMILAGVLMSLAFWTKQTASVYYPAIGLYLVWRARWEGLLFLGVTFSLTLGAIMTLNAQTEGAFWEYVFQGHQGHVFYWKNILLRYWRDLLFLAPLILLIPLLWFSYFSPIRLLPLLLLLHWISAFLQRLSTLDYPPHMYYRELWYESPRWAIVIPPLLIALCLSSSMFRRPLPTLKMNGFWLWIFIAGAGASALNHSTQWAYANCFMPISLSVSLCIPLMLRDLLRTRPHAESSASTRQPTPALLIVSAVMIQWVAWGYHLPSQTHSPSDLRALKGLHQRLAPHPGALLSPGAPLLSYFDRKGPIHTHQMGINDVAYRGGVQDLHRRLGQREWAAVLTHERTRISGLERGYYEAEQLLYRSRQSLRTKTGFLTRPAKVWLPSRQSHHRLIAMTHANFEPIYKKNRTSLPLLITFKALGWRTTGDAFGAGAIRGKGRGFEGLWLATSLSAKKERGVGRLSADLGDAPPQVMHLSFLARAVKRGSRSKKQKNNRRRDKGLEVRLISLKSGQTLSRAFVRHTAFTRYHLQLRASEGPLRVEIIDRDPSSGLEVDDFKWQPYLD